MVILSSLVFFLISSLALLTVFLVYPLFLYLRPPYKRSSRMAGLLGTFPRVSVLVVVHNASLLIEKEDQ